MGNILIDYDNDDDDYYDNAADQYSDDNYTYDKYCGDKYQQAPVLHKEKQLEILKISLISVKPTDPNAGQPITQPGSQTLATLH